MKVMDSGQSCSVVLVIDCCSFSGQNVVNFFVIISIII